MRNLNLRGAILLALGLLAVPAVGIDLIVRGMRAESVLASVGLYAAGVFALVVFIAGCLLLGLRIMANLRDHPDGRHMAGDREASGRSASR